MARNLSAALAIARVATVAVFPEGGESLYRWRDATPSGVLTHPANDVGFSECT